MSTQTTDLLLAQTAAVESRVVLSSWGSASRSNHGQTIKRPTTPPG
jgi:hypothetical protein